MRRYVAVPYEIQPEDVAAARELIRGALPIVFGALDIDPASRLKIEALLRSDMDYLEPFLLEHAPHRPAMTVSRLAKGANIARSNLYAHCASLATKMQRCALALTMLLAARGDFCDASMWMACELDSPVGRGSSGPGRVGGRQRLWGIALVGGDVMLPVILTAPTVDMDEAALLAQLEQMLDDLAYVVARLRLYAAVAAPAQLEEFGLAVGDLLAYSAMTTIMVPELHLGAGAPDRWLEPVELSPDAAQMLVTEHAFDRSVVEVSDEPYSRPTVWKQLSRQAMLEIASRVARTDLDLGFRPSSVTYYIRRNGTVIHRRQHPTSADGKQVVANDMSYAISGWNLRNLESMSSLIACIEFLATKTHIQECGHRCAEQLTPCLLKAHEDEQRALVFALRTTLNSALVAVGRDRQARGLDDSAVR
jgi:AcrR family transcriptional regulator